MFHDDDPIVTKTTIAVYIRLTSGKEFTGEIFLNYKERITDLLNDNRLFIPIALKSDKTAAIRKSAIEEIVMDNEDKADDFYEKYQNKQYDKFKNSFLLTLPEAQAILGLQDYFTKDELTERHRSLIMSLHPDRGGSDFLTAQLNAARDFLLDSFKSGK